MGQPVDGDAVIRSTASTCHRADPAAGVATDHPRRSLEIRGRLVLVAVVAGTNMTNFAFNAGVSRLLGPQEYGAFGAVLGILVVISVPATALQIGLTRGIAEAVSQDERDFSLRRGFLQAIKWSVLAAGLLAAIAPLEDGYLHLGSVPVAVLVATYAIPIAVNLVPRAVLLGEERYGRLAVGTGASALIRLVSGLGLVWLGAGVVGAVAGSVLGEAACALIVVPAVRQRLVASPRTTGRILVSWQSQLVAVSALSGFWVLNGIDTVMARHYLTGPESGLYSAASVTAGIATFLPTAIAPVMLPRYVALLNRRSDAVPMQPLMVILLSVIAIAGAGVAVVSILGPTAIRLIYGSPFALSTTILPVLAASAGALAVVDLLLYFLLASRSTVAAWTPWVGVALLLSLALIDHATRLGIALEILASTTTVAVVALLASGLTLRSRKDGRVLDVG